MAFMRAKLALFALTTFAGTSAFAAGSLFCCIDATGKQVCADILPQACYGRAYRELGADGRTLRVVEAPLTAEQRAARAAEEKQRKAEEAAVIEQRRKDVALLNTYGSEKDIDFMREHTEAEVHKAIKGAEDKIVEIRALRKKYENEAEFYKKKTLPNEVKRGLADADYEIKAQQEIIEGKKQELEQVRVKYDDDRRRYQDLIRRGVVR
jgi:hypothetical protein